MSSNHHFIQAIKIVLKWKWHILGATLLSAIIAALVSLFAMKEWYSSRAIIYPINQGITDRSTLFNEKGETQVEYYGTKNDVNRLLEIANSSPITDFLINHFHIVEHYGTNPNAQYYRTKLKKKFLKNYQVIKTEREAIEITVLDTDPDTAAAMVNLAIEKIDEWNKAPVVKNKLRIAARFAEDVITQKLDLDTLTNEMNELGKIYSISIKADDKGNSIINGNSAEGVEKYKVLQQQQQNALLNYNKMVTLKNQYELSAKENVPSVYVVEQAYPAEKKEKPVRSLIVITTAFITLILAVIAALLSEQIKEIRTELKNA
jgi:uncharacterized protein involved in exopolysaccharide biosynthesis